MGQEGTHCDERRSTASHAIRCVVSRELQHVAVELVTLDSLDLLGDVTLDVISSVTASVTCHCVEGAGDALTINEATQLCPLIVKLNGRLGDTCKVL